MPASPAWNREAFSRMGRAMLLILAVSLLASCARYLGPAPGPSGTDDQSSIPSAGQSQVSASAGAGGCTAAPDWLRQAVQDGLVVRGATIAGIFVGPAGPFTSGSGPVMGSEFASASWIAARIDGAGVRPEVGLWVADSIEPGLTLFAANSAALRYSAWGQGGSDPIRGEGSQAVIDCIGPIPES